MIANLDCRQSWRNEISVAFLWVIWRKQLLHVKLYRVRAMSTGILQPICAADRLPLRWHHSSVRQMAVLLTCCALHWADFYSVSKNVPFLACCNFDTFEWISINSQLILMLLYDSLSLVINAFSHGDCWGRGSGERKSRALQQLDCVARTKHQCAVFWVSCFAR